MSSTLTFEDVHNHPAPGYYLVPNEDTVEWRSVVKGLRIDRAAAICSSGEVGLVAILPTVRKELVLIDHSYASLSVAMLKYVMLRELGASETKRLLTAAGAEDLRKNLEQFVSKLPKAVQEAYAQHVQKKNTWEGDFTVESQLPTRRPTDVRTTYINHKLQREWGRLPQRDLLRCATKLDRVKFLHGDLRDLAERGPFDLIYLSNALEHTGRNGQPVVAQIQACLRPGGYAIVAHRGDPNPVLPKGVVIPHYAEPTPVKLKKAGWEVVKSTSAKVNMGWSQTLYRIPEAKAQEAAA